MTHKEAVKLLALIKVAYPSFYRDADEDTINATIAMWQTTFPHTPYVIMEMAFEHFRRKSKFPPTVAEFIEELKDLYITAVANANMYAWRGDRDSQEKCEFIIACTYKYARELDDMSFNIGRISNEMLIEEKKRRYGLEAHHE